ncbi:E3 ubiquitin-protein ligase MARCHF4-like [Patiria miniata]|uniref:RING-type E3 ubiquitin transferase n=1 Tax=Patiria miniata TaxID=46514 RepID=A0A913Z0B7_PATMI|nr:E3 ubiquitin-protein ligase MARCHF4-like [Patiria miniata]
MDNQKLVAKPAEREASAKMETSSHTPLLAEGSDGSTPTADDTLFEVQYDASDSGHPPIQSTVGSIHKLPSASQSEQREPAGAPLATISFNEGSTESINIGGQTTEQVTLCMCCEGGDDHDPCRAAAAQSDGTWNRTGRFQNGAAASAGATAGSPPDRPSLGLEASQSLPAILVVSDHTTRHSHQAPSTNEARCQPSSAHQPAGQSSSVRHPRVTGIVSDSMLSLPTGDICRICHTGRRHEPLLGPCLCAGSMRYTHQRCLTTWLAQSGRSRCELCGYKFKTKMVGSRNIFQWKVLQLNVVDKLHLTVFLLSLVLFAGTTAYIGWTAFKSDLMSSADPTSLAAQILLPVYCSLSFVSLGLLMYETKNTCLRLARRWRALNMGLRVLERESDDGGDAGGVVCTSGPDGLERLMEAGTEGTGRTTGRVRAASESQTERTRVDGVPSDWSVWSEPRQAC